MTVEATAEPGELLPQEPAAEPDGGLQVRAGAPIGVRMLDGGIIEVALPANEEIEGQQRVLPAPQSAPWPTAAGCR
ncbi:hypothetical protein PJ267_10045 [Arthrobacter sp. OVS8]|nr:hypothetical protein PJ267_10045 [Arthrobacter sp. OVS8]